MTDKIYPSQIIFLTKREVNRRLQGELWDYSLMVEIKWSYCMWIILKLKYLKIGRY